MDRLNNCLLADSRFYCSLFFEDKNFENFTNVYCLQNLKTIKIYSKIKINAAILLLTACSSLKIYLQICKLLTTIEILYPKNTLPYSILMLIITADLGVAWRPS